MISAVSSMTAANTHHRSARHTLAAVIGACALFAPTIALADGPTPAEVLFKEGRTLLDAKKYDEACPKLAESQKLEPGAGTLLALALCHEGQGKPATASAELKRASELGRQNGRNDLANAADKRAAALEASVPHLVIHLPENEPSYRVRCDGEVLSAADLGSPVAMDPGEHKIEVGAKGKTPRSYVVRISGPGTTEIVVDKLEAKPAPQAAAASEPETPAPAAPVEESRGGAQRTIGLVLVGAGVVGLGVGAVFLGRGVSESGEAKRTCPTTGSCEDNGADANERSKDSFRTAVIGLTAGTVALTAGAIVYFLAPSGSTARGTAKPAQSSARFVPAVGPTGASLGVVGTF
jgi:hypothetical protein